MRKGREPVKPDISDGISVVKPEEFIKKSCGKIGSDEKCQAVHKSNIVPGSSKMPIYNSFVGFITNFDKSNESKVNEGLPEPISFNKRNAEIFYDQAVTTEEINKEVVVQNLNDAYNMIKEDPKLNITEDNIEYGDKFSKVVRGFNFKEMLADESMNE